MAEFDFKRYHIRAMNAASEEEKQAINQELKDLYDSLPEEDKNDFNTQLQQFLIKETARIKSDYESVHGLNGKN
jgi:lipase chaperone LimK